MHRWWLDVTREGVANVADRGPVILAANHLSFIDSVLLMYSLPRRVSFLGKAECLSSTLTRRLFPAAGMIPVDRSGRSVGRSLSAAAARLEAGEIIGIFPEGTRSRDGLLHRGHPGAAHLALKTGTPIVPVGILGSDKAMPVDHLIPRWKAPITLRFGVPVDPGRWAGAQPTGRAKREITEVVMDRLAELTGQPRADGSALRHDPARDGPQASAA